jgi:flagellar basal-body rod protein FlgC
MTIGNAMNAAASGMAAERLRMDVTSANIANANSMRTKDAEAFQRRIVVLSGTPEHGVKVERIDIDRTPSRPVHDPSNPNADQDGNVFYSNVNPIMEMVNMMTANRAYEANIAAFNSAKGMAKAALNIGKV